MHCRTSGGEGRGGEEREWHGNGSVIKIGTSALKVR